MRYDVSENRSCFTKMTVDDLHDLIRILEEHPEWRAELRRVVLEKRPGPLAKDWRGNSGPRR